MEDLDEIREFFAKDRFATENGAVIEAVGKNTATVGMKIEPRHRNAGIVMGGRFSPCGFCLCGSVKPRKIRHCIAKRQYNVLRASKGDKLIATAECVRDGRTTCYYRVSVTDNTGALIAEITTSGYKTS
ncbi:MAG: PaaI family thioesterase [[Eubacterium] siraeum]